LIDSFIIAESALQQVTNPSGSVSTGGLGEPKFKIDGTAFTGSWGRYERSNSDWQYINMSRALADPSEVDIVPFLAQYFGLLSVYR